MLPIAADIAINAVSDQANSARPNAPIVADEPPREPRIRTGMAAFLRASAQRRVRLADRLDPCAGRAEPVAG